MCMWFGYYRQHPYFMYANREGSGKTEHLPGSSCGDFRCVLITFENGLDPDLAQQNFWPELDPNCMKV